MTTPRNPNKWGKTLAPWFNEECRTAKKALAAARREFGRGDARVAAAAREYSSACRRGRAIFALNTPEMLKY